LLLEALVFSFGHFLSLLIGTADGVGESDRMRPDLLIFDQGFLLGFFNPVMNYPGQRGVALVHLFDLG
jgi:hypothetical protein